MQDEITQLKEKVFDLLKFKQNALFNIRRNVESRKDDGLRCPACDRYIKRYKRQIHSSMAWALIIIYRYFQRNSEKKYLHFQDYVNKLVSVPSPVKGSDFFKLKYWGLISAMPGEREDGSDRVGWWNITDRGNLFVENALMLPKYAHVYNQKCEKLSGELISITKCLGTKFDYKKLMGVEE